MRLPMKAFNLFYQQASKMEALQYRELLDISMSPGYKIEYYKELRARYNSMIYKVERKLPPTPPAMYLDAASEDAKNVMFGVFRSLKRGLGYGG